MKNEAIKSGSTFTGIQNYFRRTSSDEIYVKSPCVFTENPYHLRIGQVYEIHDMNVKDGIKLVYVKLLWVYLKSMTFHVIAVDIKTGELVHISQRLNNDSVPCNFLICDLLYFDFEDLSTKILKGLTEKDMELLEFDFDNT